MRSRHHDTPRQRLPSRITPVQAVAFGLVAASVGWAAWLYRDRPTAEQVELLPGTVLPSSEMAIVEAAFDRAQLAEHRTEDGRVWVPRTRQSAYMRALVDAEALPREFGSSLRRALEQNSPWQSRAVQEESLRVAVQEELAHVICSMPGIERAAVLYDVAERAGFERGMAAAPVQTASVNIRTQPDVELEPARVQAIRVLVASSIAGLDPDRVAVTDLRNGRVHAGSLAAADPAAPDATVDPELARRIAHERHLTAKVRQAVGFVKGAVVDVTVAFAAPVAREPAAAPPAEVEPPEPPSLPQRVADANVPAEVGAPPVPRASPAAPPAAVPATVPAVVPADQGPTSIVVSLAVPDAYLRAAVAATIDRDPAAEPAAVELAERERLAALVRTLLPPTAAADGRQVHVSSFPTAGPRDRGVARRVVPPPAAAAASPAAAPAARAGEDGDRSAEARIAATVVACRDVAVAAWEAIRRGDPAAVPREAWLAAIILAATTLLWMLVRGQPTDSDRTSPAAARRPPRIDWSAIDDGARGPAEDDPSRRMAA